MTRGYYHRKVVNTVTALALTLMVSATPVVAGVAVSPVSLELSHKTKVGQVTLYNQGNEPIIIQASAAEWLQTGNRDEFKETRALLVAPAVVEIPARSSQIFRVALRGELPRTKENAFRLYLEDVTAPIEGSGLNLRVRHDLPVMVIGASTGEASPELVRCPETTERPCIRVVNKGTKRLKITRISMAAGQWRKEDLVPKIVLSGAWREWSFDAQPDTGPVQYTLETSSGRLSTNF